MFTHYKLGPHVLELELRPCVLGVSRPTVIKWLKPGWRDKRNEVVRRMDAGSVTPIRLTDDEIAWTPEAVTVRASGGEIIGLDTWGMAKVLTGAYGPGSPGRIPTISPLNHQCVRQRMRKWLRPRIRQMQRLRLFSSPLVRRTGSP